MYDLNYTYIFINVEEGRRKMNKLKQFLVEEDGIGVVEIILILLVLVGLIILFKSQITSILADVFKNIRDSIDSL